MAAKPDLRNEPIGPWLKRADAAITQRAAQVLQDRGLTRSIGKCSTWYTSVGLPTRAERRETMQDFVDDAQLGRLLADLADRGWLAEETADGGDAPTSRLTAAGVAGYRDVSNLVNAVRMQAVDGIPPEHYTMVIQTLQKVVANLERSRDQR